MVGVEALKCVELRVLNLFNEGMTGREVAKAIGCSLDKVKGIKRKISKHIIEFKQTKSCKLCGAFFVVIRSGRHAKFCTEECRVKHFYKVKEPIEKICEHCGQVFMSNGKANNCSVKCSGAMTGKKLGKPEKRMLEEREREERRLDSARIKLTKVLRIAADRLRECSRCKREFVINTNGNKVKYCVECFEVARLEQRKEYEKFNRLDKEKRWAMNGEPDRSINLEKLHSNDEGVCHLCEGGTDYEDYVITEEGYFIAGNSYPSIDHVVPIALGGVHQWHNVRLAHRLCNSIKGDRVHAIK